MRLEKPSCHTKRCLTYINKHFVLFFSVFLFTTINTFGQSKAPSCKSNYQKKVSRIVIYSKKAKAELKKLKPNLMSKAKDFLRELSYAENHQNIAKKWGLERLKYMGRTKFSGYSVRLNSGYRLMYRITSSNAIQVERISKNASHARGH